MIIFHYDCSYYYVFTGLKVQTIFCITFWHLPSDASLPQSNVKKVFVKEYVLKLKTKLFSFILLPRLSNQF